MSTHCYEAPRTNTFLNSGQYQVIRSIGLARASFEVLLAYDWRARRQVILKSVSNGCLLSTASVEAALLVREAGVLRQLRGDARFAQILGRFYEGQRLYLVLDFVDGGSLYDLIERQRLPLPLSTVLDVGQKMANALAGLHARSIIHKDVKPANVMLTRDGDPIYIDFGSARLARERVERTPSNERHAPVRNGDTYPNLGTPGYAPPEAYGALHIPGGTTPRSDVFSLGAILHQLISGEDPGSPQKSNLCSFSSLRTAANIPDDVASLVEAMLEEDGRMRPSAAAVAKRLEQVALHVSRPRTVRGERFVCGVA